MVRIRNIEDEKVLSGKLEGENLISLDEPICKSRAKALLEVRLGEEQGRFYFNNGSLISATSTSLIGSESAYNLISWRNGSFRVIKGKEPQKENVHIAWDDFQRFYLEEIEKVVLTLIPKIHEELFFELRDKKNNQLYCLSNSEELKEILTKLTPLYQQKLEDLQSEIKDQGFYLKSSGRYLLLIKYLKELRYFVVSFFTDSKKHKYYMDWLEGFFEPRALGGVSIALGKADKKSSRGTILVIDDSPISSEMLKGVLTGYRFRVITAEDGYEGLVKMRDESPDMVFLDVMMPRIDGYEVLRRIKRDEGLKGIPVVMLTAKGLHEDGGAAFKEGAELYIEKPFSQKKILAIVENVLGLE